MEEWSGRCNVDGFEDGGKRPQVKECRQYLEAGKGKDMDPPL